MGVGKVYLVGAGPGDPGLLTVKGQELLRRAEVVIYDHLVAPVLLQRCRPGARLVYVGKQANRHAASQSDINQRLIRAAKAGRCVVRLKGGDPFLFGRGAEEASALARAGIGFEIVPGVTSALAVPAYAGIPLTERSRSSSVAILTGHEDPAKRTSAIRWKQVSSACDTLVFLMGVSTLAGLVAQLRRHGRRASTPAAVIEWGTWPQQRTTAGTLATIVERAARARVGPPAILVVGEVVRLRHQLNWFESKPLIGRRILVTRASNKAGELARQLETLGAQVEELPAIALAPVKANGEFRQALRELPKTDWVFFTSPEGIGWFDRSLRPQHKTISVLSGCRIGAIGPKTASAIEEAGLHVDFVPRRFSQEGLLADLPRSVLRGKRALILSAQESREALVEGLRRRGVAVRKVPIYRTVMPASLTRRVREVFRQPFDLITVTSARCVAHLEEALRRSGLRAVFARQRFASIGPVTSEAVRVLGGQVAIEAGISTIEGLIDAMTRQAGRSALRRKAAA